MVFINFEHHEILDVVKYLGRIEKSLSSIPTLDFTDDYRIEVSAKEELAINYEYLISPEEKHYHREIIATILANPSPGTYRS
jgi:hypothetical protein